MEELLDEILERNGVKDPKSIELEENEKRE